jgi:hypothetical protein
LTTDIVGDVEQLWDGVVDLPPLTKTVSAGLGVVLSLMLFFFLLVFALCVDIEVHVVVVVAVMLSIRVVRVLIMDRSPSRVAGLARGPGPHLIANAGLGWGLSAWLLRLGTRPEPSGTIVLLSKLFLVVIGSDKIVGYMGASSACAGWMRII